MTLRPCRYLKARGEKHECVYWNMELKEDETLPCLWPGALECYESDGKGCIFEDGKWMTLEEYDDFVADRDRHQLPWRMEYDLQNLTVVPYDPNKEPE